MEKIRFIINPKSGVGSKEKIPALVADLFRFPDFDARVSFTEYAGHAPFLTKEALKENADIIVAVGGDGTVNEVARSMVHSDAALGIVPQGSGNGLARELKIPMDARKALEVITKKNRISIDYCKANKHIFFCTCGVGFDAKVIERFTEGKIRGSIGYFKSIIDEYVQFKSDDYEIFLGEKVIHEKAFLITCANASQYGNNAYIAPNASIQDGEMDIVVLHPFNPLEAGPAMIQLFTKQIEKNDKMSLYRSKKVIIKRSKPGPMHIDGELIRAGKKITLEAIPSGLQVIIPLKEDIQSPIQAQITDIQSFFREITNWINDIAQKKK